MTLTTLGIDIGIINFSFCVLQQNQDQKQKILEWKRVNLLDLCGFENGFSCKKVTPIDLHNISDFVFPKLFSMEFMKKYTVNHIAIEQQPHGKFGQIKMIMLSHLLFSYFRRLVFNLQWPLLTVSMMSASQKYQKKFLTKYELTKQKRYNNRKALGVELAEKIGADLLLDMNEMTKLEKADDMADSFLIAYSEQLNWITVLN